MNGVPAVTSVRCGCALTDDVVQRCAELFVTTPGLQAALASFKVKWVEREARIAALESLIVSGEQQAMTEGACALRSGALCSHCDSPTHGSTRPTPTKHAPTSPPTTSHAQCLVQPWPTRPCKESVHGWLGRPC